MIFRLFKSKHKACDELPHYQREVVVTRGFSPYDFTRVAPFSAYLVAKNNNIMWRGTSGRMKDKYLWVLPDDEWTYED